MRWVVGMADGFLAHPLDDLDEAGKWWTTSGKDDWCTPSEVWRYAGEQMDRLGYSGFTLDAAARSNSARCSAWFGPDHSDRRRRDALVADWGCSVVWCNPPYSREAGGLLRWCAKFDAAARAGAVVCALFFVRCETKAWHRHVVNADEVHLFEGRLRFVDPSTGERGAASAPAPSCLVIWRPPRPARLASGVLQRRDGPRFVHVPRSVLLADDSQGDLFHG